MCYFEVHYKYEFPLNIMSSIGVDLKSKQINKNANMGHCWS